MKRYPQFIINVKVSAEGKLHFYTDEKIKQALGAAKEALGCSGRIVVRPSGTEPLIRVMSECEDANMAEKLAKDVAAVIKKQLSK